MGLMAAILDLVRTDDEGAPVDDVQVDPGGGGNVTARHFGPSGYDAPAMNGDLAFLVEAPGSGAEAAVGYLDGTAKQAARGEVRIYARDGGDPVMVVWLKKTGGAGDGPSVELGIDPSDFVALASQTQAAIDKIYSALNAMAAAVPVAQDGGAAIHTAFTGAWGSGTPPEQAPEVASETVKVQP